MYENGYDGSALWTHPYCCHKKDPQAKYGNTAFSEYQHFCRLRIGLEGGAEVVAFRTVGMPISMSNADDLKDYTSTKSCRS